MTAPHPHLLKFSTFIYLFIYLFIFYFLNFKIFNSYMRSQTWKLSTLSCKQFISWIQSFLPECWFLWHFLLQISAPISCDSLFLPISPIFAVFPVSYGSRNGCWFSSLFCLIFHLLGQNEDFWGLYVWNWKSLPVTVFFFNSSTLFFIFIYLLIFGCVGS